MSSTGVVDGGSERKELHALGDSEPRQGETRRDRGEANSASALSLSRYLMLSLSTVGTCTFLNRTEEGEREAQWTGLRLREGRTCRREEYRRESRSGEGKRERESMDAKPRQVPNLQVKLAGDFCGTCA